MLKSIIGEIWSIIDSGLVYIEINNVFKILHNFVELHLPNYINHNNTRGHEFKFSLPAFTRIYVYKYSFSATIPIWNNLPIQVARSKNTDTFIVITLYITHAHEFSNYKIIVRESGTYQRGAMKFHESYIGKL